MNRVYCPYCRRDVEYKTISKIDKALLDGKEYEYKKIEARCNDCGQEVFVGELHDTNLDSLYDVYRYENDIISRQMVQSIPDKYDIGKRPLSILLGWGEQTLSRYLDGKIPTREYSEELKNVINDPKYYYAILEENKEKLSDIAYSKSKKAVLELLQSNSVSESPIDRIANYLLKRCSDITPLALQKTLYYCQGFSLGFFGEVLFADDCQAWEHGPVYSNIYQKYKTYIYHPIVLDDSIPEGVLSTTEKIIADNVIKYFGCYSGKVLEAFTHSEEPWIIARKNIPAGQRSNEIITKESIKQYFQKVIEKFNMTDPTDIKEYSEAKFQKVIG